MPIVSVKSTEFSIVCTAPRSDSDMQFHSKEHAKRVLRYPFLSDTVLGKLYNFGSFGVVVGADRLTVAAFDAVAAVFKPNNLAGYTNCITGIFEVLDAKGRYQLVQCAHEDLTGNTAGLNVVDGATQGANFTVTPQTNVVFGAAGQRRVP